MRPTGPTLRENRSTTWRSTKSSRRQIGLPTVSMRLIALVAALSIFAATVLAQQPSASRYLVTWVGDIDRSDSDFLAVLDVDPKSKTYTKVLNTVPVDAKGTVPHHTE